jgi:hypothetical protein
MTDARVLPVLISGAVFGTLASLAALILGPLVELLPLLVDTIGTAVSWHFEMLSLPFQWLPEPLIFPLTVFNGIVFMYVVKSVATSDVADIVIVPFEAGGTALVEFFTGVAEGVMEPFAGNTAGSDATADKIESIHREYRQGEIGDLELENRIDAVLSEQEDVEPKLECEHTE